jgi:hypothetical protein
MSVIIFDGPEKAGKSTIIDAVRTEFSRLGYNVGYRHWGQISPDDRVYSESLKLDTSDYSSITLWDRGWPSEFVYGTLLNRDRRMVDNPWLGEWLHGRAVQANGLRVMVLGPSASTMASIHTEDDLPVSTQSEKDLYEIYAERFGWLKIHNSHTAASLEQSVDKIVHEYLGAIAENNKVFNGRVEPAAYCGAWNASTVFVGDKKSAKVIPGGWLPFTSRMTTAYGMILGDRAFGFGWTNAHDCPPAFLKGKTLIACGVVAQSWANNYVKEAHKVISIPHPSYLFRFKNEGTDEKIELIKSIFANLEP